MMQLIDRHVDGWSTSWQQSLFSHGNLSHEKNQRRESRRAHLLCPCQGQTWKIGKAGFELFENKTVHRGEPSSRNVVQIQPCQMALRAAQPNNFHQEMLMLIWVSEPCCETLLWAGWSPSHCHWGYYLPRDYFQAGCSFGMCHKRPVSPLRQWEREQAER